MLLTDLLVNVEACRHLVYDGNVDAAERFTSKVRSELDIYESPRLTGELKLVEGLIAQAAGDWGRAVDNFRRAEVFGRLAGSRDLIGFALSWSAHCGCNTGDPVGAAKMLVSAASHLAYGRLEMRHRFALVAAELSCFVGDLSACRQWFAGARQIAGRVKSRGLFSATVFNQSALQAWWYVLCARIGLGVGGDAGGDPLVFLQSASNYDGISGVAVRVDLHRVVQAQVLGAGGHHGEALLMLGRLIDETEDLGEIDHSRIILESAWNQLRLQSSSADLAQLRIQVMGCFRGLVDEDDLAFAHLILAQIYEIEGDFSSVLRHNELMAHYVGVFRQRQSETGVLLAGAKVLDVDFIRNFIEM